MHIRREFSIELNRYYLSIHVNDFSSFIKSDFRDGMLFDLSPERAQRNAEESQEMLRRIACWKSLPDLTWEESVELQIAEDFCRYILRNSENYWYQFNLTHNTSPLPYVIKRLETYHLEDEAALELYVNLLNQFPDKLADMVWKLQEQERRGILLPAEQQSITLDLLHSLLQGNGSLLLPWNRPSVHLSFSSTCRRCIEQAVLSLNQCLEKVMDYLRRDYNRAGKEVLPGLCHVPGGLECYHRQILTYTSYALPPEKLHAIGLEELAVTQKKMEEIISQLGLSLDIPAFQAYLQKERICFDDTPEQLQQRFDRVQQRIEPRLKEFFLRQPKARCRSQALPKEKESSTSWGYYSVPIGEEKEGVFYYSAADLDSRSQIRTAAIVGHELLPGHHFQTNLIAEDLQLPLIAREHFNTAYADGWAEYSADLLEEMGIYDLYDLYGRYVWDLVLCCRLVVDTGLNAMGWTMAQARAFMRENTILTDGEIFTETLRYSVDMPAQALAYKFGSLKMHQLRRRAQAALGARFDLSAYHEEVLRYGSVPLNILDEIVEHFIASSHI